MEKPPLVRLFEAVKEAKPWIKGFENMLASSLSCDSRSHDDDRAPRRDINAVLHALTECESTSLVDDILKKIEGENPITVPPYRKLKPCPFCLNPESTPETTILFELGPKLIKGDLGSCHVECSCGITTTNKWACEEAAIKEWNTREKAKL